MSVYGDLLTAVRDAIAAASYPGLSAANIKVRMLPVAQEEIDALPEIIVAPGGPEQRTPNSGEDDHVTYDVLAVIVAPSNQDYSTNLPTYLGWRETMRRAANRNTLAGVSTVFWCEVDPAPPFDAEALNANYAYSAVGFKYHSIEPRN